MLRAFLICTVFNASYKDSDQITRYTDPRSIDTTATYNGFGDVLSETSADRGTMGWMSFKPAPKGRKSIGGQRLDHWLSVASIKTGKRVLFWARFIPMRINRLRTRAVSIENIDWIQPMARRSKMEVSAINLRIPVDKSRNYRNLIDLLYQARIAIKVYGDSFVAITQFDNETGLGVFSKYSEIDIDGTWFDLEDFGPAEPDKVDEVSIPENLRPNLSAFYFELNEDTHVLTYESYSESKGLSARSVKKYFGAALKHDQISSIRLNQGPFSTHILSCLIKVFASMISFRIRALKATFFGFPAQRMRRT